MYKIQEKPDERATMKNGGGEQTPLLTLKDEYGGVSHIVMDDHCYVLLNGSVDRPFAAVTHWYPEAAKALVSLISEA